MEERPENNYQNGQGASGGVALKKCPYCKADIEADSVFCEYCGAKVADSNPVNPAPPVTPVNMSNSSVTSSSSSAYDEEDRPKNYLGRAIAGVILCWPFGISGIVNASKVNSLWDSGKKEEAIAASERADSASKTALILGIIANVISFVYYFVVGFNAAYNY